MKQNEHENGHENKNENEHENEEIGKKIRTFYFGLMPRHYRAKKVERI